jgi:hypothetical protein
MQLYAPIYYVTLMNQVILTIVAVSSQYVHCYCILTIWRCMTSVWLLLAHGRQYSTCARKTSKPGGKVLPKEDVRYMTGQVTK